MRAVFSYMIYHISCIFITQRPAPSIYHISLNEDLGIPRLLSLDGFREKELKVVLYNDMHDETGSSSLSETAGELFNRMKVCYAERPRLREHTMVWMVV
jgi:hypothetical protein